MHPTLETLDLPGIATRARAHAGLFTLPLKEQNWKGSTGDFAGSGVGASLDFQDHRLYAPGDDPRHINWQAYARTGEYTLKLYREEVRPIVEILFDTSDSMFSDPEKAERALELFYFLYAAGEQAGAATSACVIRGDHWKPLEIASVFSHHWVDIVSDLPPTEPSARPNLTAIPSKSRSLRILLSDLLFPDSPEQTLQILKRNGGRPIILCPFTQTESDPGWLGNYDFIDSESGRRHERRVDTPLLNRYLETYRRHFERWKSAALRIHSPFARIPSATKFEAALKLEAIPSGALSLL